MFDLASYLPSFVENKVMVCNHFLDEALINTTYKLSLELHSQDLFRPAKVGKGVEKKRKSEIRGDSIFWITEWHEEPLKDIYLSLSYLQSELRKLYLPVKRFESHFAYYSPGEKYVRHKDRHKRNPNRLMTAVLYLGDWQEGDGGELMIYLPGQEALMVKPFKGNFVLFDSEFEHEVLVAKQKRWSLTSWFRDDIDPKINL